MNKATVQLLLTDLPIGLILSISLVFLPPPLSGNTNSSNAADHQQVRPLAVEIVPEADCPISVTAARTELDLDPFGAPQAARTYVDYKNVGAKPIIAVQFRVRFYNQSGSDRGTFLAPDTQIVEPGALASQKWRTDKVDPSTSTIKLRVLQVKDNTGSIWKSTRLPARSLPGSSTIAPDRSTAAPDNN